MDWGASGTGCGLVGPDVESKANSVCADCEAMQALAVAGVRNEVRPSFLLEARVRRGCTGESEARCQRVAASERRGSWSVGCRSKSILPPLCSTPDATAKEDCPATHPSRYRRCSQQSQQRTRSDEPCHAIHPSSHPSIPCNRRSGRR